MSSVCHQRASAEKYPGGKLDDQHPIGFDRNGRRRFGVRGRRRIWQFGNTTLVKDKVDIRLDRCRGYGLRDGAIHPSMKGETGSELRVRAVAGAIS